MFRDTYTGVMDNLVVYEHGIYLFLEDLAMARAEMCSPATCIVSAMLPEDMQGPIKHQYWRRLKRQTIAALTRSVHSPARMEPLCVYISAHRGRRL